MGFMSGGHGRKLGAVEGGGQAAECRRGAASTRHVRKRPVSGP